MNFLIAVLGYALAFIAGAAASYVQVPLAWVCGPLVVSATLSLCNVPVKSPTNLRRAGQLIIGGTAGLSVTSSVVFELLEWIPIMLGTAAFAVFASATISPLLSHFGRLDMKTSFFSLMPGGMAEMGNIGELLGAKSEPIALVHAFRIAVVVVVTPAFLLSQADLIQLVLEPTAIPNLETLPLLGLLSMGLLGALVVNFIGMNNPWMIGALIVSAILSGTDMVGGKMPYYLYALGQLFLGYNIGSRFKRETLRCMGRISIVSILCIFILVSVMAFYAFGLSTVADLDFSTAILVSSPGGTAEMTTTAQSLHLGVAIVAAFHLTRSVLVNGFVSHFWQLFNRSGYFSFLERVIRRFFVAR